MRRRSGKVMTAEQDLSIAAYNVLMNAGVHDLVSLHGRGVRYLRSLPRCGEKIAQEIVKVCWMNGIDVIGEDLPIDACLCGCACCKYAGQHVRAGLKVKKP